MSTIKPCPFCGGSAEYFDDLFGEGFMRAVGCVECPAVVVETSLSHTSSKEALIEAWNKRCRSVAQVPPP